MMPFQRPMEPAAEKLGAGDNLAGVRRVAELQGGFGALDAEFKIAALEGGGGFGEEPASLDFQIPQ
jgi:hypothetical protein